jgi:predicted amidophosphoribosyltransferase
VRTARHRGRSGSAAALLGRALADAAGLALPTRCAGCGRPDVALCRPCLLALVGPAAPVEQVTGSVPPWWPPHLPLHCGTPYAGVVRTALVAWKDQGRADLTPVVGAALGRAVRSCLAEAASTRAGRAGAPVRPVLVVPVPSARARVRERGADLVAGAARRGGLPVTAVLRQRRGAADQAGLDREQRRANLAGRVRCTRDLGGLDVLLVDDVVTTGASLVEAARAVEAARGRVLGAATVAATPRVTRGGPSGVGRPGEVD